MASATLVFSRRGLLIITYYYLPNFLCFCASLHKENVSVLKQTIFPTPVLKKPLIHDGGNKTIFPTPVMKKPLIHDGSHVTKCLDIGYMIPLKLAIFRFR